MHHEVIKQSMEGQIITAPVSHQKNTDKNVQSLIPKDLQLQYTYLPLITQLIVSGFLVFTAIHLFKFQTHLKDRQSTIMLTEKGVIFLYLWLECCSDLVQKHPITGMVFFSILMNALLITVTSLYSTGVIVFSLVILLILLACLSILAIIIKVDFTDFNSHFVSICLAYCILSLLGSSQYWASFLQRMLSLLVGAILFCCFIVSNFQQALKKTGKPTQEQYMTILRLSMSIMYLYLAELISLTA